MPPAVLYLKTRLAAVDRREWRYAGGTALLLALHACAAVIMVVTERNPVAYAVFGLSWGVLNFLWLILLRRPLAAAALSLASVGVLIRLSLLKHSVLFMTVNFIDLMIIDSETF